jgi:DnaJ-class molecular chaperone
MGKSGSPPPNEKKKIKWFFEERDDEEICPLCEGMGGEHNGDEWYDCDRCEGTGVIFHGEK